MRSAAKLGEQVRIRKCGLNIFSRYGSKISGCIKSVFLSVRSVLILFVFQAIKKK